MRLMVIAALMIGGGVVEAEVNSRQDEVAALRELASREVVRNAKVVVRFRPQGAWDAAWVGVDAGVFNAGFSVSVDSKVLRCKGESPAATFKDALGRGQVVREEINDGVRAIREVKVYDSGVIAIAGEIRNETQEDVVLKAVRMVDGSSAGSGWSFGDNQSSPGVVKVTGISTLECEPPSLAPGERRYSGTQVVALGEPVKKVGLVIGFLRAELGRPDVNAVFRTGEGGSYLVADQNLYGRKLKARETVKLDTVYLAAGNDPFALLENYADAVAKTSQRPVRKGGTGLWCSWYAHRMAMTEELVLKNAQVAAKHFAPLGFEVIQLDHGWQKGDVTGDWIPNERFPHGLKWLADELKNRYGFKLGLWISPTDVAETSDLFKQHPDWVLKGDDGKPRVNWKWYWKPNPNCFELDASRPEARQWIEQTFARLRREGASYFKIDFIAASGGEQFVPSDPCTTRGWGVLKNAMESIRKGAGEDAWIRYCQPPPLLSVGLASSAYGGDDTYDAGIPQSITSLRANARSLAAGYWINDRLYHREVCDMSVRMQADVEEVRTRLAIMALAGCSISFSDELQYLPPSRLKMMQQVLPPGAPPMRPLDLWQRQIPSIWHLHCKNESDEWEVVGLFNWEDKEEERTIECSQLGIDSSAKLATVEFWEQKFRIVEQGKLTMTLPPRSSRILSLRKLSDVPQVIGTDMHVLQGFHELKFAQWDPSKKLFAGEVARMKGLKGNLVLYIPDKYKPHFPFPLDKTAAQVTHVEGDVWNKEINFTEQTAKWEIPFD